MFAKRQLRFLLLMFWCLWSTAFKVQLIPNSWIILILDAQRKRPTVSFPAPCERIYCWLNKLLTISALYICLVEVSFSFVFLLPYLIIFRGKDIINYHTLLPPPYISFSGCRDIIWATSSSLLLGKANRFNTSRCN